jgi:transposase InsO family protein
MVLHEFSFLFRVVLRILIGRILRTDFERELLLVLKENQILKRKQRRVLVNRWDKEFYIALSRQSRNLFRRMVIIRPETILAWHRRLAKWKWSFKHRRLGRPPVTDEIRRLVIEMKHSNPRWGAQRIVGELRKLGLKTCKSSVAKILNDSGLGPGSNQPKVTWKTFMASHGKRIFACDFFSVDTIFLRKLDVFFIIDVATREVVSIAVKWNPDIDWLRNHLRGFLAFSERLPDILISDRDSLYGKWMKPFLKEHYGVELRQTPFRMPVFNSFAERMVRTFRTELTDRLLFFNERDLDTQLQEYIWYYNSRRPHSSLGSNAPIATIVSEEPHNTSGITRHRILGGLVTDYRMVA